VVDDGHGVAKVIELAERIATNTVLSNFAVVQALPRIARSDPDGGFLWESLMADHSTSRPPFSTTPSVEFHRRCHLDHI